MNIEISKSGSKNYYDEYLAIITNYSSIRKKPKKKIKKQSVSGIIYLIISVLITIIFTTLYLLNKNEKMFLYISIFFGVIILLSILFLILTINKINSLHNMPISSIFSIDNSGITLNNSNNKYELKWDNIKYIIIYKYSIIFIPIKEDSPFLAMRSEYKEQVIETLKKLKKDDFIIDNNN